MKIAIALLFVSSLSMACPKGSEEFNGNCAEMPSPSESALTPMIRPSDEKPSRHPESAWERGEVKADMPASCAATRKCSDDIAINAQAQGKKAARIQ